MSCNNKTSLAVAGVVTSKKNTTVKNNLNIAGNVSICDLLVVDGDINANDVDVTTIVANSARLPIANSNIVLNQTGTVVFPFGTAINTWLPVTPLANTMVAAPFSPPFLISVFPDRIQVQQDGVYVIEIAVTGISSGSGVPFELGFAIGSAATLPTTVSAVFTPFAAIIQDSTAGANAFRLFAGDEIRVWIRNSQPILGAQTVTISFGRVSIYQIA